jgi:hypothetical protein
MAQFCGTCSRANPDEATYCFYDGAVLPLRRVAGGRLNAAIHPFAVPLAFTAERACHNFEQLLRACQEEWDTGVVLLRQGTLATFFARIGRPDLARAASGRARAPDLHVALDELLALLPGPGRCAAKLRVQPPEVVLGPLRAGEDRTFTLALANLGERLLCGTIASECPWLTPGDQAAVRDKSFRFHDQLTLPVRVLGKRLFAGLRAHEGNLSILSNGGSAAVRVRVEVPSQPFPGGVLAGARTPRELVERVRAVPAEAVAPFESGEVAAWYERNGWTYPVAGPFAAGLDAVRQFLAALGLPPDFCPVKAPLAILVPAIPGVVCPAAIPLGPPRAGPAVPPPAPVVSAAPAARAAVPFDKAPLAGARTPRELVERVRAAPGQAVALFDSGEVAAWYRGNGWVYPVVGPHAAGRDAVRQFFAALRLPDPFVSQPPEHPAPAGRDGVSLHGQVREQLRRVVQARSGAAGGLPAATAQATSDQSWLSVQVTRLDNDAATLLLVVSAVPDLPGTTLQARVNVVVNDEHRLTIPVTLTVAPQG